MECEKILDFKKNIEYIPNDPSLFSKDISCTENTIQANPSYLGIVVLKIPKIPESAGNGHGTLHAIA